MKVDRGKWQEVFQNPQFFYMNGTSLLEFCSKNWINENCYLMGFHYVSNMFPICPIGKKVTRQYTDVKDIRDAPKVTFSLSHSFDRESHFWSLALE